MKRRLEESELVEEDPEHWETYMVKVSSIGGVYRVTIPKEIANHLHIRKGDIIQVAIRRPPGIPPLPEDVKLKYLTIPPPHYKFRIKKAVDAFLASGKPYAMLYFTYKSVCNFLRRHPEYKERIRVHVIGERKPCERVWIERLDREEKQ